MSAGSPPSSARRPESEAEAGPPRRLRRAERREQILAATRAEYTATSLDDIAAEAGITRVILYRHFDSKTDRKRAVLDRACTRLAETVGTGNYGEDAIATLVRAAATPPTRSGCCSGTRPGSRSSATRPTRCPPPMG